MTNRNLFSKLALLCVAPAFISCAPESEAALIERARGIHDRVITLDTHDDISPLDFTAERNYTMDLSNQVTLPKMEAGGLDVSWMVVYVGQEELNEAGYARAHQAALDKFDAIHRLAEGDRARSHRDRVHVR